MTQAETAFRNAVQHSENARPAWPQDANLGFTLRVYGLMQLTGLGLY